MGSRKTVPLRMFRIVPLGDLHICFKLNSTYQLTERDCFEPLTRASSGVMVAHLIPTLYF